MASAVPNKAHVYSGASLAPDRSQGMVAQRIPPGSSVLELGPGSGTLTRHLSGALQCAVTVVETDPAACQALAPHTRRAINADIEDDAWLDACQGDRFDVIVFADVLEHLRDPWLALDKTLSLLADGGQVIVSIPHVGHSAVMIDLFNGHFTYRRWGILDDTHLRFFTREGVLALLQGAGLKPTEIAATYRMPEDTEFHNSYLDVPFGVAVNLAGRPDAHVFQYIVTATRPADAAAELVDNVDPPVYGVRQHAGRMARHMVARLRRRLVPHRRAH